MTLSNKLKYESLDISARILSALPPFFTTLHYFPLWIEESPGATFSGVAVLSFIVCMVPMWRKVADLKKFIFSASMPVFWIIIFALFYFLAEIARSMIMISLAGLAGSLLSIPLILWRNKYRTQSPSESKKE